MDSSQRDAKQGRGGSKVANLQMLFHKSGSS